MYLTPQFMNKLENAKDYSIMGLIDQLAKLTFCSHYAHAPFVTEQGEGPMNTVVSIGLRTP